MRLGTLPHDSTWTHFWMEGETMGTDIRCEICGWHGCLVYREGRFRCRETEGCRPRRRPRDDFIFRSRLNRTRPPEGGRPDRSPQSQSS